MMWQLGSWLQKISDTFRKTTILCGSRRAQVASKSGDINHTPKLYSGACPRRSSVCSSYGDTEYGEVFSAKTTIDEKMNTLR